MKTISGFRIIPFWLIFTLPVLSGCANKTGQLSPLEATMAGTKTTPQTNKELLASIQQLREESTELKLSDSMFRRKMSLTYSSPSNHLSKHQQKVIDLFFQTLPDTKNISIIISIAPTSAGDDFNALHTAWTRIQELKNYLQAYSIQIEELYLPDQSSDTVTIQVLGGESV